MVYLRKKKVKGVDYLYLVKSTWDKEKKTSRQETIKYLGESTSVTRDDIPEEFREDAKINSFLLQNTPKDREKREKLIEQLRTKLFSSHNVFHKVRIYQAKGEPVKESAGAEVPKGSRPVYNTDYS